MVSVSSVNAVIWNEIGVTFVSWLLAVFCLYSTRYFTRVSPQFLGSFFAQSFMSQCFVPFCLSVWSFRERVVFFDPHFAAFLVRFVLCCYTPSSFTGFVSFFIERRYSTFSFRLEETVEHPQYKRTVRLARARLLCSRSERVSQLCWAQ